MADAAAAAVDLILARRAWAVVVRDNDCNDKGEGGDPPVPNDAAASGSGDYDNVSSRMQSGGGGQPTEEGGYNIAGTMTTRRWLAPRDLTGCRRRRRPRGRPD